ncbi:roadblock/LC7 domain-containing protein [Psychrobacter sp. DAB_AL43B]|uniref:roadblock/LC7 domain-containing protein n=1 Tax=Psychrobacter sp. DAB_AL43B TaxID=1028416 RepID=UPI0011AB6191|nr:roadblock/LC7 domain-containing protein [Psychrobacter sp. DAB_AL43B]
MKTELLKSIKELCESNKEIVLVSLCTTDGFPITYLSIDELSAEADKMAAISSTLAALSNSSARQMNQGECDITIIEASSGNMLFVTANYLGTPCVLTVVANTKMTLAEARYKTKKLTVSIAQISE